MTFSVLVVGSGAIGSFYGIKLAQSGCEVSTLHRSDYKSVLEHGIRLKSPIGDTVFHPKHVLNNVDDYPKYPDLILVATKALPWLDIPSLIRSKIGPQTKILLIQNGIGVEDPYHKVFPTTEIISGLAFICVSKIEHGHVIHHDYGRLVLGNMFEKTTQTTRSLAEKFQSIGIHAKVSEKILEDRWKKLIWNVPFNPLSVLGGGVTTQDILATIESETLVRTIMKEVQKVAIAEGMHIGDDFIEKNITETQKMIPYKTSMLLDFENGRPLEIDAILGNVITLAKNHEINVPNINMMAELLRLNLRVKQAGLQ